MDGVDDRRAIDPGTITGPVVEYKQWTTAAVAAKRRIDPT